MENTTPVPNNMPNEKAPVQNTDVNTHVDKNTPPTQGVGGDRKDEKSNIDVVKENKDVTAADTVAV
ncbi:MAG TPA: hypothetical protein VIX80_08355 [Candidatus Kapabacteria bacterium]